MAGAQELLDTATAEFEGTFATVILGNAQSFFFHVDGTEHDYIQVTSVVVADGESSPVYDTAEEAVNAWRSAVRQFEGKKYLYWRVKPVIEQDQNEKSIVDDASPNPTFGKWRVYSRFRVLE